MNDGLAVWPTLVNGHAQRVGNDPGFTANLPPGSTAVTWNQPKAGGGGLSGLREFTANGSFVALAGVTHVLVEAWGGGGGGAPQSGCTVGGGDGSGGMSVALWQPVQTRRRAGGHRPLQRLLRCAERGSVIGDATSRIVDDSNQARVHHEPVAVGVEVRQVGPRTGKDVEVRLFRRPKDGNERDGFSVVPPDPDDGETQLRSTCGRDDDGVARSQAA